MAAINMGYAPNPNAAPEYGGTAPAAPTTGGGTSDYGYTYSDPVINVVQYQWPKDEYTYEDMTPMDRAVAQISGEQWNRYISTFRPLENKVIADVQGNDRYAPQVQGAINANLMQKQTGMGDFSKSFGRRGTQAISPDQSGESTIAQSAARGSVEGSNALDTETAAMTQNLVELGRGGGNMAASGLGSAAKMATQSTISDWQYTQGQAALDTQQALYDKSIDTAQSIQTMGYLSSLFSSIGGVAGYGISNGWFSGGGGGSTWAGWDSPSGSLPAGQSVG